MTERFQCNDDDKDDQMEQLTDEELMKLNSVSTSAQNDATFIRILMEILYKNNMNALMHRSFTGQMRKSNHTTAVDVSSQQDVSDESFKAISPSKKKTVFTLFKQRIEKIDMPAEERLNRIKTAHIKRLVAIAIGNHRAKIVANMLK